MVLGDSEVLYYPGHYLLNNHQVQSQEFTHLVQKLYLQNISSSLFSCEAGEHLPLDVVPPGHALPPPLAGRRSSTNEETSHTIVWPLCH